jgi:hypothetical protein
MRCTAREAASLVRVRPKFDDRGSVTISKFKVARLRSFGAKDDMGLVESFTAHKKDSY